MTTEKESLASDHSRFPRSLRPLVCPAESLTPKKEVSAASPDSAAALLFPARPPGAAIAPQPEVARLWSLRRGRGQASDQWGGGQWALRPRPGTRCLWGSPGRRAEARQGTNHRAGQENTAHPAVSIANLRPEAGRPEDIQINSTSSLFPTPPRKRKKEGRGNTDPCQSLRKARPHPAQQPMAQQRTDKDIPWGCHSQ